MMNKSEALKQTSLGQFFLKADQPKPEFKPIDVVREPKSILRKRRGRPRKYDQPQKKRMGQENNIETLEIEAAINDDRAIDEDTGDEEAFKRGPYQKLTYTNKLKVLKEYIKFKSQKYKINGKTLSLNEFYHFQAQTHNSKFTTIKSLCAQYERNNTILVQLEILSSNDKAGRRSGQVVQRQPRLKNLEQDHALADWLYCNIDLGYIITRENIREKALEMIKPTDEDFKASDKWLDLFLKRHMFSLRKLNEKAKFQTDKYTELSEKSKIAARETIILKKIKPSMIINMDETPLFWEYLPNKVIAPKMAKNARGWKRSYHQCRSTLTLAVAADGTMLRPTLILKRKEPYILRCHNDIDLLIQNSENGWAKSELIVEWLERVLIPYVRKENCLLIWDSFEAHISHSVLNFLKNYPNINVQVVVGGMTSLDQPLDISINKRFKSICKQESIKYSNSLLDVLNSNNMIQNQSENIDNTVVRSKYLTILSIICLVNGQVTIARKDMKRSRSTNQSGALNYLLKTSVEDIYKWIRKAYLEVRNDEALIKNAFRLSGFFREETGDEMIEELSHNFDAMEIEKEGEGSEDALSDGIPLDDISYEAEEEEQYAEEQNFTQQNNTLFEDDAKSN